MPNQDTQAIVAAILAATKIIIEHGPPHGASDREAYEAEYRKMLDRVQNPNSPEPTAQY